MKKIRAILFSMLAVATIATAAQAQVALEVVEKNVAEKWSQVKSMTAKMTSDSNFEGQPLKSFGPIEFMNDNGRELVRLELKIQRPLPDRVAEALTTMLYDGAYLYTVTDHSGTKAAAKQRPENLHIAPGGRRFFQLLRKNNALRVLPDDKLEGQDVYVIEARPKSPTPQTADTIKFFLSKETGMMLKSVGTDANGNVVITNSYSDIKLNGPATAERFKFEPPPGVDMIDATKPAALTTP